MSCHQAIVWIDSSEAFILRMGQVLKHESTIVADTDTVSSFGALAATRTKGLAGEESADYFHRVARALDVADEILIVGPSATKLEFVKYMHKDDHALDPRILGVETIANHTDSELAAFAKLYFAGSGPRRSGNGSRDT